MQTPREKINALGGYVGLDGIVHQAENTFETQPEKITASFQELLQSRTFDFETFDRMFALEAEAEFVRAKRLEKIRKTFPKGFLRYRVKNYERGEFRAK